MYHLGLILSFLGATADLANERDLGEERSIDGFRIKLKSPPTIHWPSIVASFIVK